MTSVAWPYHRRRLCLLVLPLISSLLLLIRNIHHTFLTLTTSSHSYPPNRVGQIGEGKDAAINLLMGLAPPVMDPNEAKNSRNIIEYFGVSNGESEGVVWDTGLGSGVGIGDEMATTRNRGDDRGHVYEALDGEDNSRNDDDTSTSLPHASENELKPLTSDVSGSRPQIQNYVESGRDEVEKITQMENYARGYSSRPKMTPSEFYKKMTKVRVKRKKQGSRWEGWYKDVNIESRREKEEHWWRNSPTCFEVDHMCHLKRKADWEIVRDNFVRQAEAYLAGLHQWFYYDERISIHDSARASTRPLFQPSMELKFYPTKYDRGKYAETRIAIRIKSPSSLSSMDGKADAANAENETAFDPSTFKLLGNYSFSIDRNVENELENTVCRVSPTPTHIVVQSAYNDMIGEFYTRTLVKLHRLMSKAAGAAEEAMLNDSASGIAQEKLAVSPWERDVQFYVHLAYSKVKLLDAHKLLLSGMFTSPKSKDVLSFLDLFVEKDEDVTRRTADNDAECQCYEKMVFCGYDVYVQDGDFNGYDDVYYDGENDDKLSEDSGANDDNVEPNSVDDEEVARNDEVEGGHGARENYDGKNDSRLVNGKSESYEQNIVKHAVVKTLVPPMENVWYTLWPGDAIEDGLDRQECSHPTSKSKCQDWGQFRDFLLSNIVRHYPSILDDFASHRRQTLIDKGFIDESYRGDTNEWKIVGLTQRTYRRTWLNLSESIDACDKLHNVSQHKVACIEVNVEKTKSPMEQLLLHGKLDGLIGVHGAQMTQAILLPRHAHVLELLPWIPDYISGNWVQRRSSPTPLGVIFHNTDLNHLGYSLGRDSVPLCEGEEEENEKKCFLKRTRKADNFKKFLWPRRNFNVNPEPIAQYIEKVVIPSAASWDMTSCEEITGRLDKRFVWYNIWCDDGGDNKGHEKRSFPYYYAKHFYDVEDERRK